jgi:outer membrane protein W
VILDIYFQPTLTNNLFMKKSVIIFAIVCVATISSAKAQDFNTGSDYKTAIGVKFLSGAGVSFKHFLNDKAAFEGIAFWGAGSLRVTGLYELHFDINELDGLKWYVGPGAHIGFYQNNTVKNNSNNNNNNNSVIGIDGVLGLDYKIKGAPLNVSLDWQPTFEFGQGRGFTASWGGFAIRYTF